MTYDGITYEGFYYEAGQFFKLVEDSTFEQAENGFKALQLMQLALIVQKLALVQEVNIDVIMKIAYEKLLEHKEQPDDVIVKGINAMKFLKSYAEREL